MSDAAKQALRELVEIHDEVDRTVAEVASALGGALSCAPRCTDCCVDDLTVFVIEAERVRARRGDVLAETPGPEGRCAMLGGDGLCRIYEDRPYVCRTQGLPLRWLDEDPQGALVEQRDICPVNEPAVALLDLDEAHCWTLGPTEGRLASLQARLDGGALRRVSLRSLFASK